MFEKAVSTFNHTMGSRLHPHLSISYDISYMALAFPQKNIMQVNGNLAAEPGEWYHAFIHELAHFFCYRNEFGGKRFKPDGVEIGYKIWTELVAEYMATRVMGMKMLPKKIGREDLKRRLPIAPGNLYDLSFYLVTTVMTEGSTDGLPYSGLVRMLEQRVEKEQCGEIDREWIEDIGAEYLREVCHPTCIRTYVG